MTKVVSSEEMARIEKLAYAEGASEEVFMEAAGKAVAQAALRLIARLHPDTEILLLCGKGNNGGDAYVAGRHLLEAGLVVSAIQIDPKGNASPLLKKQRQRFAGRSIEDMNVHKDYLIIDGLFGTGFHGSVQGDEARLIEAANASGHPILAIDIPSGLNGTTGEVSTPTIRARESLALGLP